MNVADLFIYSVTNGFELFEFGAIMKHTAMNILENVCCCTFLFISVGTSVSLSSGIARLQMGPLGKRRRGSCPLWLGFFRSKKSFVSLRLWTHSILSSKSFKSVTHLEYIFIWYGPVSLFSVVWIPKVYSTIYWKDLFPIVLSLAPPLS